MAFEIINRVLEELNLDSKVFEEYKSKFSDQCMDDATLGTVVGNEKMYFRLIERIVPRLGHAIQIRSMFIRLFSSRNERERSGSASRTGNEGQENTTPRSGSGSTDSMLATSMTSAQRKEKTPASSEKSATIWTPAPGPSTRRDHGREHDQRANSLTSIPPPIPEVVGPTDSEDGEAASASNGALGLESFQVPMPLMLSNKRKRKELDPELNLSARNPKESKKQVSQVKSNDAPRGKGS